MSESREYLLGPDAVTHQEWQTTMTNRGRIQSFANCTIAGLSVCQMILGVFSVALGVLSFIVDCDFSTIGTGIWCGVFFMVIGIVGLISAVKKTSGPISALLVLSIISASMVGTALLASSIAALSMELKCEHECSDVTCIATNALIAIVAVIEVIVAVVTSTFCCRAVCCNRNQIAMYDVPIEGQRVRRGVPMQDVRTVSNQNSWSRDIDLATQSRGHYSVSQHYVNQPSFEVHGQETVIQNQLREGTPLPLMQHQHMGQQSQHHRYHLMQAKHPNQQQRYQHSFQTQMSSQTPQLQQREPLDRPQMPLYAHRSQQTQTRMPLQTAPLQHQLLQFTGQNPQQSDIIVVEGATANVTNDLASSPPSYYAVDTDVTSSLLENEASA
ncbi:vacuolar protein-sorting-associated protein 36-like [Ptychodera flava]|uniref:vacuolar protein-sorting-associated protein 36-like n=1 Tax=Ptychodera flava TaxID=63121 RepID=UPI00396A822D